MQRIMSLKWKIDKKETCQTGEILFPGRAREREVQGVWDAKELKCMSGCRWKKRKEKRGFLA